MTTWNRLAACLVLCTATASAQEPPPAAEAAPDRADRPAPAAADPPPKSAPSRVTAVTVYQGNALITREVEVPEGRGLVEFIVTPLPPESIDSSLYTEGTDGLRVLSTRYRTRAVKEDTRAEVRAKEQQIKALQQEAEVLQNLIKISVQNLQFLDKLENFTGATLQSLSDKGLLNSQATLALSKYVMETRVEGSSKHVEMEQKLKENAEKTEFANRELAELTSGASRTERDAVIVVDKGNAKAGTVKLNYLVGAATWRPHYRFRAGAEKDPIQLEYLAAIEQQSGEDWPGVDVVLSTAQPMLNATPPDLLALDITVIGRGMPGAPGQQAGAQGQGQSPQGQAVMGGIGGGGGMGGGMSQQFREQSKALRQKGLENFIVNNPKLGGDYLNDAAALEQADELLARKDDRDEKAAEARSPQPFEAATSEREGPSVTYHLKSRLTVPSRNDEQLIEVARIEMQAAYFYKAVPVLSPHVYRLADLTNKGDYVILPGEATMYVGSDFVGRMNLPLVAIGERYTVGFGVDPQLQVTRKLVKKSRSLQGGNQVHHYEYRITAGSYKSEPAKLQVWDRMPRAEAEAVAVSLVEPTPKLSDDPAYLRVERPENLLRWDLTVAPGMAGETAATIAYQFKLEYARDVSIANFKAKR